ncbi:ATP adenylyltransferase-domain-containing protein [Morchella snyderi]|nr:ATP adenylyltransferase-domain-containing protein [Morchella snyderi]
MGVATTPAATVPENLPQLISEKFRAAVADGSICYTPSETTIHQGRAFTYHISILPFFSRKPNDITTTAPKPHTRTALSTVPASHVVTTATAPHFRIILNKFCAVENQVLLISVAPRFQTEPLDADELAVVAAALRTLGPGQVAFYNCGKESGASQPHKHVQVVALGEPVFCGLYPGQVQRREDGGLTQHPDVPYTHFIAHPPPKATAKQLHHHFSALLAATRRALGGPEAPHYNFLMTAEWMVMVPRTRAECDGVGVNSLGMVGVLWLGDHEQLAVWSAIGFDEFLGRVGVGRE